jgi:hypothetical protein
MVGNHGDMQRVDGCSYRKDRRCQDFIGDIRDSAPMLPSVVVRSAGLSNHAALAKADPPKANPKGDWRNREPANPIHYQCAGYLNEGLDPSAPATSALSLNLSARAASLFVAAQSNPS